MQRIDTFNHFIDFLLSVWGRGRPCASLCSQEKEHDEEEVHVPE